MKESELPLPIGPEQVNGRECREISRAGHATRERARENHRETTPGDTIGRHSGNFRETCGRHLGDLTYTWTPLAVMDTGY